MNAMSDDGVEICCPACGGGGFDRLRQVCEGPEDERLKTEYFLDEGTDHDDYWAEWNEYDKNAFLEKYRDYAFTWKQCSTCGSTIIFLQQRRDGGWYMVRAYTTYPETQFSGFYCPYCWSINKHESKRRAKTLSNSNLIPAEDRDEDRDEFRCRTCDQSYHRYQGKIEYKSRNFEQTHHHMMEIPNSRINEMLNEAENMGGDLEDFHEFVNKVLFEKDKKRKRSESAKKAAATRKRNRDKKRLEQQEKVAQIRKKQEDEERKKAEAERKRSLAKQELLEKRNAELENQREKNYLESGHRETDEEKPIREEKESNERDTGILETNDERKNRETNSERESNRQETGISETDVERKFREEIFEDPHNSSINGDTLAKIRRNEEMGWALWMNSPIIGGEAFNAFKVIIQRNEIGKGARLLMKKDIWCVNNDEWKRELQFLIIPD
jgi:hypothetical protein